MLYQHGQAPTLMAMDFLSLFIEVRDKRDLNTEIVSRQDTDETL